MHKRVQKVIDVTADELGLDKYYLKRHSFVKEEIPIEGVSYELTMEWFPNEAAETEEGLNPPGTALVDVDLHSERIKKIIFVNDISYAHAEALTVIHQTSEQIIEWVEEMTGLEYGRQFQLVDESKNDMHFRSAVDNIPVYPGGNIDITFNEQGQLTLFSIHGSFPTEDQVQWEPFALTSEIVEPIALDHCKLMEIPVENEQKWISVYGTSMFFLTNNGGKTISYDQVEKSIIYCNSVEPITWSHTSSASTISLEKIDLSPEISESEALSNNKEVDRKRSISKDEQTRIITEVSRLLQQELPDDNGQWKLTTIQQEHNYLFAILHPVKQDFRIIGPKIKVIMDSKTLKPLNYMDNRQLLDVFRDFKEAEMPVISKGEASEKLRSYLEISPVYVYQKGRYMLCGKIECGYVVDAVTGEMISLDE